MIVVDEAEFVLQQYQAADVIGVLTGARCHIGVLVIKTELKLGYINSKVNYITQVDFDWNYELCSQHWGV